MATTPIQWLRAQHATSAAWSSITRWLRMAALRARIAQLQLARSQPAMRRPTNRTAAICLDARIAIAQLELMLLEANRL